MTLQECLNELENKDIPSFLHQLGTKVCFHFDTTKILNGVI